RVARQARRGEVAGADKADAVEDVGFGMEEWPAKEADGHLVTFQEGEQAIHQPRMGWIEGQLGEVVADLAPVVAADVQPVILRVFHLWPLAQQHPKRAERPE